MGGPGRGTREDRRGRLTTFACTEMRIRTVGCTVRVGDKSLGLGELVLELPMDPLSAMPVRTPAMVSDRVANAIRWALDLDAQYADLLRKGLSPKVSVSDIPAVHRERRLRRQTSTDYRELGLGTGEMIRPLLLDPPDLQKLFPYQRKGVDWLIERKGAILADDMGLGKTVQVIAAIRVLFNRAELRSALVICPKGMIATWIREFARWAPELGVVALTPPPQLKEEAWRIVSQRCHVLLTNYEQLRKPPRC